MPVDALFGQKGLDIAGRKNNVSAVIADHAYRLGNTLVNLEVLLIGKIDEETDRLMVWHGEKPDKSCPACVSAISVGFAGLQCALPEADGS